MFKDYLISKGYDGIKANEFWNTTYGAFYTEQIKSVDNTNPTSNPDIRYSLSKADAEYDLAVKSGNIETAQKLVDEAALENRVSGDELLNAQDTLEIIKDVGGSVDNNGYVTLYHRTSKEKAKQIIDTKRMSAKEDGIFFSTSEWGYNDGYGDSVLEFKVPVEKIVLDDIFGDEAHFRIPLKNRTKTLDVSEYIISENDGEYSLSNPNQNIAPTKDYRIYGKDIKLQNDIAPVNKEVVAKNATAEDVTPVKTDEPKDLNEAESKGTNSTDKPVRPLLRTEMKSISRSIKRSYGSTFEPNKDIMRLYNAMHSGKLTAEEAAERATEIGKDIADNIKTKQVRTAEAQEVLDVLRNSRIKLDVEQISEVSKMYDGYNNYKQSMFGKVIISKNGIDLDTKWQELSEEYPYIFDPDVNPQEQPQELANIISDLQNSYEQQDVPDATEIGVEIYQKYFEVPERRKTHGEIQREKVEAMKEQLAAKGFDLDKILEDAKDKSSF